VAERTVQTVKNIALLLRPSMLEPTLGLAAALEWQGGKYLGVARSKYPWNRRASPKTCPMNYKIYIYRLVEEALNNAVRHSGAGMRKCGGALGEIHRGAGDR